MVATITVIVVIFTIILALVFDFTNGFHDSANSIATVVSTKVLSPRNAVIMAALFNFIAVFFIGVAVASTISKIIDLKVVDTDIVPFIVLAGLIGAIGWNVITWYLGLPTSSSHALIGGLVGSGLVAAGTGAIKWATIGKVVTFMFLSPLVGFVIAFVFMVIVLWIVKSMSQSKIDGWFRKLQLVSAAAYSFSHGTNDAQKTMGIIVPLLFSIGYYSESVDPHNLPVPLWVMIAAYASIALGTLSGGWRIVKTLGQKITRLRPVHGFAAETAGSMTILGATFFGIPVSTTHIICSSIMGVGATKRVSAVRWGVARSILWAWFLTIPLSALIGGAAFFVFSLFI